MHSKEEQSFQLVVFILCLMKLSAKQEAKKFKTKKEQKEYEQNFSDFASKALYNNNFDDKKQ